MGHASADTETSLPFEFKMSQHGSLLDGFDQVEAETQLPPNDPLLNFDKLGDSGLDMFNTRGRSTPVDMSDSANAQLNDLLENIKASLNSPAPSMYSTPASFPGGVYTDPLFQHTPQNPIPPAFAGGAAAEPQPMLTASEQTLFADIAKPGTPFQNIPQLPPSDPLLSFPSNPPKVGFGLGLGGSMMSWNGQKLSRQYMECRKPKILFDPVYNRTVAVAFACSSCHRAKKRCIGGGIGKSCKACLKKGLLCKPRTDKRSHHSRLYSPMLTPPERAAFRRQRMIAQRMKQRARKSIVRMPRSLLKLGPMPKQEPMPATPKVELPTALNRAHLPTSFNVQLPNSASVPIQVRYPPTIPAQLPNSQTLNLQAPKYWNDQPKVQLPGSPASPEE